jgi:hypothetical protein
LLFSVYQLYEEGWPLPELALFLALLIYTSALFVKDPALVIKPHHLVKNKMWGFICLLLLISVLL